MLKTWLNNSVAIFLIALTLVACSPVGVAGPGAPTGESLLSTSVRAINENLDLVKEHLDAEVLNQLESYGPLTGEEIATRALGDENGRRYLEFACQIENDSFDTTDDVIAAVDGLVSDEELQEIKEESVEIERSLRAELEPVYRKLSSSQQEAFNKDVRALVVKAVVLLAASIVYAFVPTTVFWGKVSAAIALAVAAGFVSHAFMSILEYYKAEKEGNKSLTMTEWLKEVTEITSSSAALATGIISTGKAMTKSAFATAVVLACFSIFGILDDAKAILENYNFKV